MMTHRAILRRQQLASLSSHDSNILASTWSAKGWRCTASTAPHLCHFRGANGVGAVSTGCNSLLVLRPPSTRRTMAFNFSSSTPPIPSRPPPASSQIMSDDNDASKVPGPTKLKTTSDKEQPEKAKPSPSIVPGLALSAATAVGGFSIASVVTTATAIPLSGIPFSILLGLALHNTIGYDQNMYQPGIVYATKTVLQGGIICVAAKLSLAELVATGTTGLPVVLGSVGAGLVLIPHLGRLAGLPTKMSLLITAGTSICGVTAITALAPAIQAQPRDIAVAVANTVAFGTIGMLTYPYLFHAICSSSEQVGMCLGVAIHDTSQVLGSALLYKETYADEVAFKVAAVTKLMRNLGLVVAIPLLTYRHYATTITDDTSTASTPTPPPTWSNVSKYVPPFLMAFVGMTAFRSCGDFVLPDVTLYTQAMDFIGNDLSKYALGTAMAGVGLSTHASSLQNVGWKPFAVGLSGALVVGGTGCTIAMLTVT